MSITLAEGLARKLALKPGMTVRLIEPPAGYAGALAIALPDVALMPATAAVPGGSSADTASPVAAIAGVPTDPTGPPVDAVLAFATTMADLERLVPAAIVAVVRDGPLWIAYPKGGSGVATDLKRDVVPPVLAVRGYRPVAQIALDATWSALRFRPAEAVGR